MVSSKICGIQNHICVMFGSLCQVIGPTVSGGLQGFGEIGFPYMDNSMKKADWCAAELVSSESTP